MILLVKPEFMGGLVRLGVALRRPGGSYALIFLLGPRCLGFADRSGPLLLEVPGAQVGCRFPHLHAGSAGFCGRAQGQVGGMGSRFVGTDRIITFPNVTKVGLSFSLFRYIHM